MCGWRNGEIQCLLSGQEWKKYGHWIQDLAIWPKRRKEPPNILAVELCQSAGLLKGQLAVDFLQMSLQSFDGMKSAKPKAVKVRVRPVFYAI